MSLQSWLIIIGQSVIWLLGIAFFAGKIMQKLDMICKFIYGNGQPGAECRLTTVENEIKNLKERIAV